ncbi:FAD-dependent thiol oxidase [Meira miltonrushii]|uniref:Sulfhydryl oxidase n=1 Tax=Meira miltonrushii TaxID=1280837 RepID=A0A316VFB5_9BASI|nr:FAD-dependent thiol oxidase [Meira miltonrushii]PWN34711.1 FAD-dependent thiol oxidase [Meira miltonrushii]
MPAFSNKPIGRPQSTFGTILARLTPQVRRHPVLMFGLPFVLTIVASSFGLSYMTQTRYDYNASKVRSMSKEEELGMRKDRRKIDIREEYYRLQAKDSEVDDWEPKRIPRPDGVEEPLAPRSRKLFADGPPMQQESDDADEKPSTSNRKNVILGPDGKPCRACNSKLAFSAALKVGKKPATASSTKKAASEQIECPPDGEMIGQSTWTFLHSAAAYYPNSPSEIQQKSMLSLIQSLPHLYPCHSCAGALGEELEREIKEKRSWEGGEILQQAVRTGPGLRKWLCGVHNETNARLGKPTWTCSEEKLQHRWKDGPPDGRCD